MRSFTIGRFRPEATVAARCPASPGDVAEPVRGLHSVRSAHGGRVEHTVNLAAQAARRADLSEERIDDVRVAVSELVANAFAAQRRAGVPDPVRIEIGISDRFEVAVLDRGEGVGMEELDAPGSDPDEPTLGL